MGAHTTSGCICGQELWLISVLLHVGIWQVIHSVAHYIITSIVQGLWLQVLLMLLCEILMICR